MADFSPTDLRTDLENICSVTYGGEAFKYAGGTATFYGVFAQAEQPWAMLPLGHSIDDINTVCFSRGALTPAVNATIFRIGESTTYRILKTRMDEQAWECALHMVR